MENFDQGWVCLFLSLGTYLVFRYVFFGFPKLKRAVKPAPVQEDPWALWKKYQFQHRTNVAEAHKQWEDEAWEILRRHCEQHVYHHQNWYTCTLCGHEEPWEWELDCQCRHETVTRRGYAGKERVLMERQSWCPVHGKDYTSWPVSIRDNKGNYGTTRSDPKDRSSVEKGMALQRTLTDRRIRFMEDLK